MSFLIGIDQIVITSQTTRVGVFDDGNGWRRKAIGGSQRGIKVQQIIIGEFFAVQNLCMGDAGQFDGVLAMIKAIESSLLVGILAVAQALDTFQGNRQFLGKTLTAGRLL